MKVKKEHRDFLRFLVATYGFRKTVDNCENTYRSDVKDLVNKHFSVDDDFVSSPSREKGIE